MLTLIVPGLIWTRQALADLTHDLPLPAFATLLGKGRLLRRPPADGATILAELTGLPLPLPAAALRALAQDDEPGAAEWLCLDPVRLRFEERRLVVDDPQRLALTAAESAALAVSLAPTFAALGRLDILTPQAWNLRLAAAAPAFQPLPEAAGRVAAPLPLDAAYTPWRQALNEAQMLLHGHPVNQAREAAGLPMVNSLWPWGGGRLPQAGRALQAMLWSRDPVALGIARLQQIDGAVLPERYPDTTTGAVLALIDQLEHPARAGDGLAWRDQLAAFESGWLAPALDALRAGRIAGLRLVAPGDPGSVELRVERRDLWKFWRKPGALTELAPR